MRLTAVTFAGLIVIQAASSAPAQYGDISGLKLLKPEDGEDVKSVPPPEGAIVLFDGKNLDNWTKRDGKTPSEWKLLDGGIMQVHGGHLVSKQKFDGRFKLHVEFRVPYQPDRKGQDRGNSGVYVQGRYEVQILDSYGVERVNAQDCGAIYEISAPLKNVCKAPTVWQCYDIEFTSPRCKDGKKVEPARMTVYHNGVKVQDDVAIPVDNTRSGLGGDPCTPGPIMLQDHRDPVQFRNVWLLPLK